MDTAQFAAEADVFWRSDWVYLATPQVQRIEAIEADVRGLALPKPVIDKIYYSNARRVSNACRARGAFGFADTLCGVRPTTR